MKKTGVIITSVVCGSIILMGCTTPTTPANVAKSLDANLTNLTTTINRLDTIDNSYLSNPDIYPIANSIETPAPENKNKIIAKVSTKDFNLFVPISKQRQKVAKPLLALDDDIVTETDTNVTVTTITTQSSADEETANENTTYEETSEEDATETNTENDTTTEDDTELNTDNITEDALDNSSEQTTNFYYYDIRPVRYAPRYAHDVRAIQNEDYLTNYINKVRNLYAITNDAIMANTELNNYKNDVLTYCVEIKDLNSAIKDGTFVPTNQQVAALNNYIDDIKITIKRIKKCNGDLSDEVDSINKTDVGGITAGIDVINSNYLSVLNHLDTRITYLKNALTTLEQIKYLLQEAQNIVETNPDVTEEVITPEIIAPEETENNQTENSETSNVENKSEDLNQTESPENTNNENEDNVEDDLTEDNTNNDLSDDTNINNTETNSDLVESDSVEENETISETTDTTTTETDEENSYNSTEQSGNIDTYLNTNNNLDTYNNANTLSNETNTENVTNTDVIETVPNTVNNPAITNGTNTVYNNGTNGGLILPTDPDKINAPNGTFQNGIITQNNLNNGVNNGVNGYNTGSGYNYNNGYPYANGDINRTNKNVDSYGRNTMIDMLNHGTVNNGINTLNLTEEANTKPSMVSNVNEVTENVCENCEADCEDCLEKVNEICDNCENCDDLTCEDCKKICDDCCEETSNISNETISSVSELNAPVTNNYEVELL